MSVRINSNTDRLEVNLWTSATAEINDPYTIMGWVKLINDRGVNSSIFGLGSGSTDYLAQTNPDGTTLTLWNGGAYGGNSYSLTVGTWFHFAFTFAAAGGGMLGYIDGVSRISHSSSNTLTGIKLTIGYDQFGNDWTDAEFCDWRIWPVTQTSADINAERVSPTPVMANPYAVYRLSNAANAATDSGGAGRSATISNLSDGTSEPTIYSGAAPIINETHFRARNDDGSESGATWLASEDSSFTQALDTNLRIRYQLDTSGDYSSSNFRLEYKVTSASSWSTAKVHQVASASYGADGGAGFSAANGATITATYPSGITTNSALVMTVHQKPSTANLGTVTTPTGWTLQKQILSAGNYAATLGADTGDTNLFVYTKDVVSGTETGTFNITVGTNNVAWADIIRLESNVPCTWTYSVVISSDITAGNLSVGFGTDPGATTGDILLAGFFVPTDIGNGASFTAEGLQYPGVTLGTVTEISEPFSANGNDIGGMFCYAQVLAGTSTGVPLLSATAAGTTTNLRGPAFLLRARPTAIQYPIEISNSTNISANGTTPTTQLLSLPSGKGTSAFQNGYISDDTNPLPSLDLSANDFTELEWSIKAISSQGALNNQQYNLRITNNGTSLDSYSTSAIWTIGTPSTNITLSANVLSGSYSTIATTISGDITLGINVISATYSIQTPQINGGATILSNVLSGSYSVPAPQINISKIISFGVLSGSYSIPVSNILLGGSTDVQVGVLSASYSLANPQVNAGNTNFIVVLSASYSIQTPQINHDSTILCNVLSGTYNFNQFSGWNNVFIVSPISASYSLLNVSTVSGSDSIVNVGVISGSYSISNPSIKIDKTLNVISLSGTYSIGSSASISNIIDISSLSSSYSITTPQINLGVTISCNVLSGSYSVPAPQINHGSTISCNVLSGSYSVPAPQINLGNTISVGFISGSFAIQTPQINLGNTISVNVLSASYIVSIPQVNYGSTISCNVLSGTYSVQSPNIILGGSSIIQVGVLSSSYIISTPQVNRDSIFSIGVLSASYSISNPVVNISKILQVNVLSASYSINNPQIVAGSNIFVSLLSASYSIPVPDILLGGSAAIQVGVLSGSFTIQTPQINHGLTVSCNVLSGSYSTPIPQINTGNTISCNVLSGSYSVSIPQVIGGLSSIISMGIISASYSTPIPQINTGNTISCNVLNGIINISSPIIRRDKIVLANQLTSRYFVLSPSLGSGAIIKLRRIEGY